MSLENPKCKYLYIIPAHCYTSKIEDQAIHPEKIKLVEKIAGMLGGVFRKVTPEHGLLEATVLSEQTVPEVETNVLHTMGTTIYRQIQDLVTRYQVNKVKMFIREEDSHMRLYVAIVDACTKAQVDIDLPSIIRGEKKKYSPA